MVNNLHLNFLREKISDLKTALLYSNSKSVLKIPTTIVTAINVDDLGQIWLIVPRPPQNIKEFEQNFPVSLKFYRKGRAFYLNVTGTATIILEPGELDEMIENLESGPQHLLSEWLLVKVMISDYYYHDSSPTLKNSWISNLTIQVNKWISAASGEEYNPVTIHSH